MSWYDMPWPGRAAMSGSIVCTPGARRLRGGS